MATLACTWSSSTTCNSVSSDNAVHDGAPFCYPNTGSVASPAGIYEWVRSHVPSSAQAVFIGGNALRAIGVIAALEEHLRRPVLTANQVSLWYALRVAGAEVRVDDYGQLFKMSRK